LSFLLLKLVQKPFKVPSVVSTKRNWID